MKLKKLMTIALAGVTAIGMLAGCGSSTDSTQAAAETPSQTQESSASESASSSEAGETAAETTPAADETETLAETESAASEDADAADSSNVLIVYYSATGNTENVANMIAAATGGDLFELEPADPYTDEDLNYNDENSRVSQEHADESLRNVELISTTVDNWDSYDTVFIGYPIWWGIAAWPVDSFVENNDFTGKTVIPFATSASSGLGESGQLLADLAGTGDWQEGMRFRSSATQDDVQAWIDGLGWNN